MDCRRFLGCSVSLLAIPSLYGRAGELPCDVAVIGGGLGGFAAALAALRSGMRVILTEETEWIGGQSTAQAVPPDEHPWIEEFGCTRSYRAYRDAIREYYRRNYPLTAAARACAYLNPGNGWVSPLTHEFRVSLAVLEAALAPYVGSGQLLILLEHVPESATTHQDQVTSVTVRDIRIGLSRTITAKYFLDATELGDLLPLTKTEFVTGMESRAETGELHAPAEARPGCSQCFTCCFAMDYVEGDDHTIERPREYDHWRGRVPSVMTPNPESVEDGEPNRWGYRRIADRANFVPGAYRSDITLVNWDQNDYWEADLVTASPSQRKELISQGKQLSLSLLYWLQTEAPRTNGGYGWKGLRLRNDIVGTEDGLARYPYIRESRRIRAEFTVLEQHVGTQMRMKETGKPEEEVTAARFEDSVGVGSYAMDLHYSTGGTDTMAVSALPFQIPLGALVTKRVENLIPACKNIGTTHLTNGCYRLHPVEWNIGEAAGALAAYCVATGKPPRAVRNNAKSLKDFQASLLKQGFELEWPRIYPLSG